MKKNILFLCIAFIIAPHCGFAQDNEIPKFTKKEAIAAIKENYLYMYFGYPEDTIANINRFIDNIDGVVAVNKKKREKIKTFILSEIKQAEKSMTVNHVLGLNTYNIPDFIPVMGINANNIIKSSFSTRDYEKLYDAILKDRINARAAYNYLSKLYKQEKVEEDIVFVTYGNPKIFLDAMFKDYDI